VKKLVKESLQEYNKMNESSKVIQVPGSSLIVAWNDINQIGIKNIESDKTIIFDSKDIPELIKALYKIKLY